MGLDSIKRYFSKTNQTTIIWQTLGRNYWSLYLTMVMAQTFSNNEKVDIFEYYLKQTIHKLPMVYVVNFTPKPHCKILSRIVIILRNNK